MPSGLAENPRSLLIHQSPGLRNYKQMILHKPTRKVIPKLRKPLKNHLQTFRRPSIRHTRINARINLKLDPGGLHTLSG
jgi:hypothetical protein